MQFIIFGCLFICLSPLIACKFLKETDHGLLVFIELNSVKTVLKYILWENKYWESFCQWCQLAFGEPQGTEKYGQTFCLIFYRNATVKSGRAFKSPPGVLHFETAVFECSYRTHIYSWYFVLQRLCITYHKISVSSPLIHFFLFSPEK